MYLNNLIFNRNGHGRSIVKNAFGVMKITFYILNKRNLHVIVIWNLVTCYLLHMLLGKEELNIGTILCALEEE